MNDDEVKNPGSAWPRHGAMLPGYGQPGWGGSDDAGGGAPDAGGSGPSDGGVPAGAPAPAGPWPASDNEQRSAYERERQARRVPTNHPAHRPAPGNNNEDHQKRVRRISLWGLVALVILAVVSWNMVSSSQWHPISTSEGIALLKGDTVERAEVTDGSNTVKLWLSKSTKTVVPKGDDTESIDAGKQVTFQYVDPQGESVLKLVGDANIKNGYDSVVPQTSIWTSLLLTFLPMILIFALFFWLIRNQASLMNPSRDNQNAEAEMPDVTFADVAGEDEAVQEVAEVVDFLKHPAKYEALGARIPRGVLLYGPPGTGKTLLARAVAGEAGVPFYSASASEFVEMFVGMGASRVRDLFKKAKKKAPAIIFIDELDAVGRGRGSSALGSNDEREQTLNQLLVELDGFDERDAVVLIAATNRPDVLDEALLRPGRFDRQIAVDAPDMNGRYEILKVHAKGKPLGKDVDLRGLAKRTPGYSGADLANVLNEAALLAARRNASEISNADMDEASDRVMAGPQRRSRPMTPEDRRMTAYHEGGHAIAAAALHYTDPVTKVTILPRGKALGYTMVMPTEDKYSVTRNELLDQLVYALGGRVAEEVVFHDPSTGASNDIEKATETARKMVTEYGMSAKIGAVKVGSSEKDALGRSADGEHSDQLAHTVDAEVRALMEQAHQDAWRIITENRDVLDELATRLLDEETVLEAELTEIFKNVVKAPERPVWLSAPDRTVSSKPPVPLPAEPRGAHGDTPDSTRGDTPGSANGEAPGTRNGGTNGGHASTW